MKETLGDSVLISVLVCAELCDDLDSISPRRARVVLRVEFLEHSVEGGRQGTSSGDEVHNIVLADPTFRPSRLGSGVSTMPQKNFDDERQRWDLS